MRGLKQGCRGLRLEDFAAKKCSSGRNIQFTPKKRARFSLPAIAEKLQENGAAIEVNAPSLVIFSFGGMRFELQRGKIKAHTEDAEKAEKIFSKIAGFF